MMKWIHGLGIKTVSLQVQLAIECLAKKEMDLNVETIFDRGLRNEKGDEQRQATGKTPKLRYKMRVSESLSDECFSTILIAAMVWSGPHLQSTVCQPKLISVHVPCWPAYCQHDAEMFLHVQIVISEPQLPLQGRRGLNGAVRLLSRCSRTSVRGTRWRCFNGDASTFFYLKVKRFESRRKRHPNRTKQS